MFLDNSTYSSQKPVEGDSEAGQRDPHLISVQPLAAACLLSYYSTGMTEMLAITVLSPTL